MMRSTVMLLAGILSLGCATANPPVKAQPYREVFLLIPDRSLAAPEIIDEIIHDCDRIAGSGAADYRTRPIPGIVIRIDSTRASAYGLLPDAVKVHIRNHCKADAIAAEKNSETGHEILIDPGALRNPESIDHLLKSHLYGNGIPLTAIATVHSTLIRRSVLWNAQPHQMIRIGFNPLIRPAIPERIRQRPFFKKLGCSISTQLESIIYTPE